MDLLFAAGVGKSRNLRGTEHVEMGRGMLTSVGKHGQLVGRKKRIWTKMKNCIKK